MHALADGWSLSAETLWYAPVGGGSYHWVVTSSPGEQWFVTVDDLDDKGWLGRTRPSVFAGLRAALDAALRLRRDVGLRFVAAPVPALDGQTVRPLGDVHAVTVFPFLHGTPGEWDKPLPEPDLDELMAMLAALHTVDPAVVRLQRREVELSWPDDLELALRELGLPWTGGPFAEPARELLAGAAGPVRRGLDALGRWIGARFSAEGLVITHGEPHPGNLTRTSAGEMFETDRILMTAVDTGWITDERPHHEKLRIAAEGWHAPLDLVDGAARVYDPIVRGEAGEDVYGCFVKDFEPSPW